MSNANCPNGFYHKGSSAKSRLANTRAEGYKAMAARGEILTSEQAAAVARYDARLASIVAEGEAQKAAAEPKIAEARAAALAKHDAEQAAMRAAYFARTWIVSFRVNNDVECERVRVQASDADDALAQVVKAGVVATWSSARKPVGPKDAANTRTLGAYLRSIGK